MPRTQRTARWWLVLPLRGGPVAKTRLAVPPGVDRAALAVAMCQDVVRAAHASPVVAGVTVVSTDPALAGVVAASGAGFAVQRATGLAAAIDEGLDTVAGLHDGPVAVMLPDVPTVTAADLTTALDQAGHACRAGAVMAFVPDADETGTVVLAAVHPAALAPRFGPGSAAAHRAVGAVALTDAPARLRRDVDTATDLCAALMAGVGPHTFELLATAAMAPPSIGPQSRE